jgi:integrase
MALLKAHRSDQLEERIPLGPAWEPSDLVFTSGLGTQVHPRNLFRAFRSVLRAAGVPEIRFHDLRHTHATLLFKADVHPKIVSERLGHATIGLTLDTYSHVLPGMQRDAVDRLDALLDAGRKTA